MRYFTCVCYHDDKQPVLQIYPRKDDGSYEDQLEVQTYVRDFFYKNVPYMIDGSIREITEDELRDGWHKRYFELTAL